MRKTKSQHSKGFFTYCPGCFEKQCQIDALKEENARLKAKLQYQERTAQEGHFGSGTPSSKRPFKKGAEKENIRKRGGAKKGHVGHGRRCVKEPEADLVEEVSLEETECPKCSGALESKGVQRRTVYESKPVKVEKILYRLQKKQCVHCGAKYYAKLSGVLPKCLYGNQLFTHIATQHYIYGIPLGRLENQLGIGYGSLVDALHRLARFLAGVPQKLIEEYRIAPVKHADETGWRTDGDNGYAWLFCTPRISIYRFRKTRSSQVPKEVFGQESLPGVTVVDRYNAYNKIPCTLQYCYAHLLRAVQDCEKEFPDNIEVKTFVSVVAPLLAAAMSLRSLPISDRQFKRKTSELKEKIEEAIEAEAQHPAIQGIQDIFRRHANRLYHWATDRAVPADNNLAERDLRPLVIARKVSFGSQSDEGARTREILMTVLQTLRKRYNNAEERFKCMLDKLAIDPNRDPFDLLFYHKEQ
jgi:hypothetical protein